MRYENVCLESIAYRLPREVVTSEEIERQLASLYERLRLPEGRLELMTGIRQRRLWPPGTLPSHQSAPAAAEALRIAGLEPSQVGALIHGSVCRDFLEPATACMVHDRLGLPRACVVYDVANACLGLLNGMLQVADLIELGRIRAGVVVGTEGSRSVLENTIRRLLADESLSRADIKPAMASLTLGSGSAAVVLVDRRLSRTGNRLRGGIVRANTGQCRLCRGGGAGQSGDSELLMWTDSESLLREGVATAVEAFPDFLAEVGWADDPLGATFCHQVGRAHRKLLLESLRLDPATDFTTFETLGNTGSVALPITTALGLEQGGVRPGQRVALLGIGSGINVIMLAVDWAAPLPVSGCVVPA